MSNELTTQDLSDDEHQHLTNFDVLLEQYADAQVKGGFRQRVDARRALRQAYMQALKYQPNKDQS
jgi:hypothetical protein